MGNDNYSYKVLEGIPQQDALQDLKNIYTSIFEDADLHFFEERLNTKQNVLIVLAYDGTNLIGFKIGYRYDEYTFYSWVGGVRESHRQKGIGQYLAELQEEKAREQGYTKLRTKSMNRFKPMIILNLKRGFDIISVYTNEKEQTKIIFEKDIT
ncbi:GNAT family N-acetyltransferase [Winogradskyella sp. 3972H.M.0a.05]|uniref:GNAT family N-acetyltransferase n=1 Tax=Winogradskyella sp. 3972H.M.0a.05 TaxID=2950277 RepID=UPI0033911381